jgi:hypothetical protein
LLDYGAQDLRNCAREGKNVLGTGISQMSTSWTPIAMTCKRKKDTRSEGNIEGGEKKNKQETEDTDSIESFLNFLKREGLIVVEVVAGDADTQLLNT